MLALQTNLARLCCLARQRAKRGYGEDAIDSTTDSASFNHGYRQTISSRHECAKASREEDLAGLPQPL